MAMPAGPDEALVHSYRGQPLDRYLPVRRDVSLEVDRQAGLRGAAPYVTAITSDGSTETLTYADLQFRTRRFHGWLRDGLGIPPGSVVGLVACNDASSVVAIFGTLRAGYRLLLLSPHDPSDRLRVQAETLGAAVVLENAMADHRLPGAVATPDGATLGAARAVDAPAAVDSGAPALYFGTSGSTAAAKLVAQSRYAAAVNAVGVIRHHGLRPRDRLLGCLPVHHVNGLHFSLLATATAGAHLILTERFDPFTYPDVVGTFRPRIASVVPSILDALVRSWRDRDVPRELDYFVTAAAPLSSATARSALRRFGVRVVQGYGLTETVNFSTTMPPALPKDLYRQLTLDAEIPSIGTPLYGNEVAVIDADGETLPAGECGELAVRGHNVMLGYVGNPSATAEAFRHGWFHTQDLGYEVVDEATDQSYFFVTGRAKNIAKVAGASVSLDEVDRVLRGLSYIVDAACLSLPHAVLGEEVVAAVVVSEDPGDDRIMEDLGRSLPASALPRQLLRVEHLPRSLTGKLLRPQLTAVIAARQP